MSSYGAQGITQSAKARGFYASFYNWILLSSQFGSREPHVYVSRSCGIQNAIFQTSFSTYTRRFSAKKPRRSPEEPLLSSRLRKLMREMPHSVVVATSTAPSTDNRTPPIFKGMTISSFTTLTLTPSPVVTFNIRKPSRTLSAIENSNKFLIHILSGTESGAKIADTFTRGNGVGCDVFHSSAFKVLRREGAGRFHDLEPPLLAAEGITKVLRCELLEGKGLVEIGDHVIILGRVVGIIEPPAGHGKVVKEERGLCYIDRAYRQMGPHIVIPGEDLSTGS